MSTRIFELQRLIDGADVSYYTKGTSIMEDARYDKLKNELKTLNPNDPRLTQVGSTIKDNILQKCKHTIPMGSLGKAMNEKEYNDWLKNNLFNSGISSSEDLHASYKLDGGSFSLEYKEGRLIAAVSRGDGFIGEDITANAFNFKGVPRVVSHNGKHFTGFIRGEVLLLNDDWIKVDPSKASNPRNLAVGIARRKDGSQAEFLTFYAFRAFDVDGHPLSKTEMDMSNMLKSCGFLFAPCMVGDMRQVWDFYLYTQKIRPTLPYWIDGIVVKVNDIELQLSLGETSQCPKGQVAVKFEAEGADTILRNVTLQVGATGAIVPVANFDPVRIGGTTVLNATLCNWENIDTLGVAIGDTISVIKAGDIIPRIMEVVSQGKNRKLIPLPTECPVCHSKVGHRDNISGEESTAIYCLNEKCPAVVTGRIDRYLTSLDIMGIGENLIRTIVSDMGIEDPADLYILHWRESQLADLVLSGKVRLGEKRARKIIEEIEKKRILTISEFLGSLGIFGLGKRRVTLIQEGLPGKLDTLEDWFTDTLIKNAAQCGVKNMAQGIHDELIKQKSYILKFLINGVTISKPQPKKQLKAGAHIICITGALTYPKSYYQNLIELSGNGYVDSFCKGVTHLVAADPNSGSNKLEKARKAGTKVINENELLTLIS
jgi:DNA ligase (NAD+)